MFHILFYFSVFEPIALTCEMENWLRIASGVAFTEHVLSCNESEKHLWIIQSFLLCAIVFRYIGTVKDAIRE